MKRRRALSISFFSESTDRVISIQCHLKVTPISSHHHRLFHLILVALLVTSSLQYPPSVFEWEEYLDYESYDDDDDGSSSRTANDGLMQDEEEERILAALEDATNAFSATAEEDLFSSATATESGFFSEDMENAVIRRMSSGYSKVGEQRQISRPRIGAQPSVAKRLLSGRESAIRPALQDAKPRSRFHTLTTRPLLTTSASFQFMSLPDSYRIHELIPWHQIKIRNLETHAGGIKSPPLRSRQPRAPTSPSSQPLARSTPPSPSSSTSTTSRWARSFLATCHRDVLLPVPKDYVLDNFNLAHLAPVVERVGTATSPGDPSMHTMNTKKTSFPIYRQALRLLTHDDEIDLASIPDYLQQATTALYLLVHQRYVLSPRGLDIVRRRFLVSRSEKNGADPIFGTCPRLICQGMPLLPFGDSDDLSSSDHPNSLLLSVTQARHYDSVAVAKTRAKRYCPSCGEVFFHWDSKVDGCAWGPTFCHLFLLVYGKQVFGSRPVAKKATITPHEPRVFGFRLHPTSRRVMGLARD